MALPSLSDLLTVPTQQQALDQEVFPELRKRGLRVTDWVAGGAFLGITYVAGLLRVNSRAAVAAITAAGFEDYVFGLAPLPATFTDAMTTDVLAWAPIVAKQRYGLDRIAATYTRRTLTITNTANVAYGPLAPGAMVVQFPTTGNRYILDGTLEDPTATITIPASGAGGTVSASFRAEYATDTAGGIQYQDPAGASPLVLVTANYPGVSVASVQPAFAPVAQSGSGPGAVTLSGTPALPHSQIEVVITASGSTGGTLGWSFILDGSAPVDAGNAFSAAIGDNITITLTDATGVVPSFVEGARYFSSCPGTDITTVGRDAETPQELGARCRGLLPMLGWVKDPTTGVSVPSAPTGGAYAALVASASSEVKNVSVVTGAVNNAVTVYVSGEGALLSSATLAALQTFLAGVSGLTDNVTVASPATQAVALGGTLTIYARAAQLASAQSALQKRLALYLGGADQVQPLAIGGLVDHAYLVSLIRTTPGITRVGDVALQINGSAADLQLAAGTLATWSQNVTAIAGWTWAAV
jgi:hypothetical protein